MQNVRIIVGEGVILEPGSLEWLEITGQPVPEKQPEEAAPETVPNETTAPEAVKEAGQE